MQHPSDQPPAHPSDHPSTRPLAHLTLVLALVVLTLAACKKSEDRAPADAARDAAPMAAAAPASAPMAESAPASPAASAEGANAGRALLSAATTETTGDRPFVRTAQATFRVQDVVAAGLAIEDMALAHGGFVLKNTARAEHGRTEQRPDGQGALMELTEVTTRGGLLVRVPAAKTQTFLRGLAPLVAFLDTRTFEANDVQFDLLRKQLAYAREQAAQEELGRAADGPGKIDDKADAIRARRDARVGRDEAKVAQAEYADQVAFATISLSLYQTPVLVKTELPDFEWTFAHAEAPFGQRAKTAVVAGWQSLKDAGVFVLGCWPWVVLGAGVLVWRRMRRTA